MNNNISVINGTNSYSYNELYIYIKKTITFLKELNIKKNDRIVIFDDNSIETIILLFACNKLGVIFTILDTKSNEKRLKYIFEELKAKYIFTSYELYQKYKNLIYKYIPNYFINKSLLKTIQKYDINLNYIDTQIFKFENNNKIATIIYTSGSTGFPKGVMISNKNISFTLKQIQERLNYQENDRILCGLKFSFDYGLYQIFLCFNVKAKLILKKNFDNILEIPKILYQEKITILPIVPTIINSLIKSQLLERIELKNLRMITSTGDILSISTIKKLQKILPYTEIIPMYGITECKRVTIMPKGMGNKKLGSVGKPLNNIKVYLTKEMELIVEGDNVAKGYWNNPTTNKKSTYFEMKNGKTILHTGDYFKIDEDGYLYFIGRKDDLVKINSTRISLKEIEIELKNNFLDINEILIAYEKEIFIFIYGNIEKEKIIKYIKDNFQFQINKENIFISGNYLLKNSNGKIDKNELFKQYLYRKNNILSYPNTF